MNRVASNRFFPLNAEKTKLVHSNYFLCVSLRIFPLVETKHKNKKALAGTFYFHMVQLENQDKSTLQEEYYNNSYIVAFWKTNHPKKIQELSFKKLIPIPKIIPKHPTVIHHPPIN